MHGPRRHATWLAFALLGIASCAPDMPVGLSFDPLEAFPAQAGWRWDETANVLPMDARIAAMHLGPVLEEAVESELAARGYREVTSKPDYLVSYELGLTTRVRPDTSISVASLSLLMRDASTKRRVWVAFVQTEVDSSRSEAERREAIRKVVAQMLEKFPPKSK